MVFNEFLKGLDKLGILSTSFDNRDNYCDFLFDFLQT